MKVNYMKLSNNGGSRVPSDKFLTPNKTSSTGIGLYLIELLDKGTPWESLKNPGYFRDSRLSSTIVPFLKTTPT